ncbi:hypothetical protein NG831_21005 [Xanthomonas sacchari]|uniref:hypothetical protein n=1 Tax=Xanthomonas sacchari TaxID=56458 RepID=UPI002257F2FF|nr:hypothetical protein [Xanthomonas sacchari]MCW0410518.1 hypothetical protein [Xanthomonas sacchari]UYK66540.1 hypothetical protein NG831_21005 [Xanthomonas sacchari]
MKLLFAVALAALLSPCLSASAAPVAPSPLLGNWAVDVARLDRPKAVTPRFSEAGKGKWAVKVDIAEQAGGTMHAEGVAALDGRATPVKNNFEADVFALQMPAPNVLVMMLSKDRSVASTRIYTVAADGRSMTETVSAFAPDGTPTMRTNYFTRVAASATPSSR